MIKEYRVKNPTVEVFHWDRDSNFEDLENFTQSTAWEEHDKVHLKVLDHSFVTSVVLEYGDYIVKESSGLFHRYPPDVFQSRYEEVVK